MILRGLSNFALGVLAFALLAAPLQAGTLMRPTLISNFGDLPGRGGQAFQIGINASYGSPLATIIVWKGKDTAPRIQYFNPANGRRLEAWLPIQTWDALVEKAKSFHVPNMRSAPESEDANLCMHPGLIRVDEIASDGRGSTTMGDYCNEATAVEFGDLVMQAAMAVLPGCAAIKTENPNRPIHELQFCTLLKGNRNSAAAGLNWLNSHGLKLGQDHLHWALSELLDSSTVAQWGRHTRMQGQDTIKAAIDADFSGSDDTIEWIHGLDARRVLVDLSVRSPPRDIEGAERRVTLNLTLERRDDGQFRLVRIAQR